MYYLEDILVFTNSTERVFAPAGNPTTRAGEVLIFRWQTGRTNMRTENVQMI